MRPVSAFSWSHMGPGIKISCPNSSCSWIYLFYWFHVIEICGGSLLEYLTLSWLWSLGEITECLGGVALLEKEQHSEQACRIYSLTQLLLSRVLPVWGWKMCSVYFLLQSGWHAFQPGCTLSLWNHKLSWKSFFSQVIFGQKYFTTATGKHLI